MYLRMMPSTKIGIEMPRSEPTRLDWSNKEPYFLAAMKPSGIPSAIAKIIAPSASSIVAGKRWPISQVTERKLLVLVPRLPWRRSFR